MLVYSGNHAGKTTELLALKLPDYVNWMMTNHPSNALVPSFKEHIKRFNAKPFIRTCFGRGCEKPAVRATAYAKVGDDLFYWCDSCDPHETGADRYKLVSVTTYESGLWHVRATCNNSRIEARLIIRDLARAKGLPRRVGAKEAVAFFA